MKKLLFAFLICVLFCQGCSGPGYNWLGFDKNGYNKKGYNWNGYDIYGRNKYGRTLQEQAAIDSQVFFNFSQAWQQSWNTYNENYQRQLDRQAYQNAIINQQLMQKRSWHIYPDSRGGYYMD